MIIYLVLHLLWSLSSYNEAYFVFWLYKYHALMILFLLKAQNLKRIKYRLVYCRTNENIHILKNRIQTLVYSTVWCTKKSNVAVLSILDTNMYLCLLLANDWGRDCYRPLQVLVYEIAKHHRDVVIFLVY